MSPLRVFVLGLGQCSPLGLGVPALARALETGQSGVGALTLFPPGPADLLPVGEVPALPLPPPGLPRSHWLAQLAATEALAGSPNPPDAIVLGVTTGGMPLTEQLLQERSDDPARYHLHGGGTVAVELARELGCRGPALTISTACSSSAVALLAALELLRAGRVGRVLAGGVDALCRLTYHGFRLLQLVDPQGVRPLDANRRGMTVGEGAGLLLLQAATAPLPGARAELCGGGLSCDAFHATRPRPDGRVAREAIRRALDDAGVTAAAIDYINLHGTGTPDNDAAEAAAVRGLFEPLPPHSSTKGQTGHPLAAAGALEAVLTVLALERGVLPANVRCLTPDPAIGLEPLLRPHRAEPPGPQLVLSNSFGFGGNNAALVLGRVDRAVTPVLAREPTRPRWQVLRETCLTGAGGLAETLEALARGRPCTGRVPTAALERGLPPAVLRRSKQLPRLVLTLAEALRDPPEREPRSIWFGTGWGPQSETWDFLEKLTSSNDQFSSPTDFVGSVHNAPAGQVAVRCNAEGANVTTTDRTTSFEQALLLATLMARPEELPLLLLGADEAHPRFLPLLDPPAAAGSAEGGAGFRLDVPGHAGEGRSVELIPAYLGGALEGLVGALGGPHRIREQFAGLILHTTTPDDPTGERFLAAAGFPGPVWRSEPRLGRHASIAAVATTLAVHWVRAGRWPAAVAGRDQDVELGARGLLVLGLGEQLAALEVRLP